jgi:hypothetical protein
MRAVGQEAERDCRLYFTGGATAVLLGWRASTSDADIRVVPESEGIYRALPGLKESLELNVEPAAIEPALYRYPAIDPPSFRRAVERAFRAPAGDRS